MKKKQFLAISALCLLSAPAMAQTWGTGGSTTKTNGPVWIGFPTSTTTYPTGATTHIKNFEYTDKHWVTDVNLKVERIITQFGGMSSGPHPEGNLIEAIVKDDNLGTPAVTGFVLDKDFRVGIGTSSPVSALTIEDGNISLTNTADNAARQIKGHTSDKELDIYSNTTDQNGSGIQLFGPNHSGYKGGIHFLSSEYGDPTGEAFGFYTHDANWETQMKILKNGNIGINDANPVAKLTIDGEINFTPNSGAVRMIRGRTKSYMELYSAYNLDDGSGIFLHSDNSPYDKGAVWASSMGSANDDNSFVIKNLVPGRNSVDLVKVTKNGKMVIGDVPYMNNVVSSFANYKLFVQSGILTERVKVAIPNTSHWSDFVFNEEYELMPLMELEDFIKKNNHLPSIPSAEEVVNKGLDLGEMDAKLLQKVEELTLYVIDQQKLISQLQNDLAVLKSNK